MPQMEYLLQFNFFFFFFSFKDCLRDTQLRTSLWKSTWELKRPVCGYVNTAKCDRVAADSSGSESLILLVSILSAGKKNIKLTYKKINK